MQSIANRGHLLHKQGQSQLRAAAINGEGQSVDRKEGRLRGSERKQFKTEVNPTFVLMLFLLIVNVIISWVSKTIILLLFVCMNCRKFTLSGL